MIFGWRIISIINTNSVVNRCQHSGAVQFFSSAIYKMSAHVLCNLLREDLGNAFSHSNSEFDRLNCLFWNSREVENNSHDIWLFMIIVFKAVSINYKFSSRLFSNICRNIRKHFLVHRIVQNLVPMKTEHAGTTSQNFMAFEHLFLRFLDCFELVIFPVVLVLLDKPVTLSGLNCLVVGRKIFIDH